MSALPRAARQRHEIAVAVAHGSGSGTTPAVAWSASIDPGKVNFDVKAGRSSFVFIKEEGD